MSNQPVTVIKRPPWLRPALLQPQRQVLHHPVHGRVCSPWARRLPCWRRQLQSQNHVYPPGCTRSDPVFTWRTSWRPLIKGIPAPWSKDRTGFVDRHVCGNSRDAFCCRHSDRYGSCRIQRRLRARCHDMQRPSLQWRSLANRQTKLRQHCSSCCHSALACKTSCDARVETTSLQFLLPHSPLPTPAYPLLPIRHPNLYGNLLHEN